MTQWGWAVLAVMIASAGAVPVANAQTFTVLHTFTGADGGNPAGGLVRTAGGTLFGTTQLGGSYNCAGPACGTVFKLNSTGLHTIHNFQGGTDGANPAGRLAFDAAGNLWGTTMHGGDSSCASEGCGTVFKIAANGTETVVHAFGGSPDGRNPFFSGLSRDGAGNFYGTTYNGGGTACADGCGTVFRIDPNGVEKVIYSFTGQADGANPAAGVIRSAGNLYGTTNAGGDMNCIFVAGCGTIFRLNNTYKESVLYRFTGTSGDGGASYAGLIRDAQGNLYGTTRAGGTGGFGTVFELGSNGQESVLYGFSGGNDGSLPFDGVVRDAAGNLYGTTYYGGAFGNGAVFKVDTTGTETVLYSFTGGSDGANPIGSLVLDEAGNLYGVAYNGGNGGGVIYELAP